MSLIKHKFLVLEPKHEKQSSSYWLQYEFKHCSHSHSKTSWFDLNNNVGGLLYSPINADAK